MVWVSCLVSSLACNCYRCDVLQVVITMVHSMVGFGSTLRLIFSKYMHIQLFYRKMAMWVATISLIKGCLKANKAVKFALNYLLEIHFQLVIQHLSQVFRKRHLDIQHKHSMPLNSFPLKHKKE